MSGGGVFQHSSGSVECRICLSIHPSYAAYYAHSQGKRHLQNAQLLKPAEKPATAPAKRQFKTIGIPKYDIQKIRDPDTLQLGVRLTLTLEKIAPNVAPEYRIMSAYEQAVDKVNTDYQYLVVAAEPYENVALRIPARAIDASRTLAHFKAADKTYCVQLLFETEQN